MPRKYLAFDIETAKILPENCGELLKHRPLGISCAATLEDGSPSKLWYGRTDAKNSNSKNPAPVMARDEAASLVNYLAEKVAEGFTILTWNGLGFDFDVLAEESGLAPVCRTLALGHVDMMFHIFCDRGYPIGLDSASKGMSLPGKAQNVEQHLIPQMWAEGRTDDVLNYLAQDVRATLQLANACEQKRELRWITRKGTPSTMPLKQGWLTADKALQLPLPDTSWMDNPLSRTKFTAWLDSK